MLKTKSVKQSKAGSVFLFIVLTCCHFVLLDYSTASQKLSAEPFNYTEQVVDMPIEWQRKSVTYNSAIKNADLVISLGQQTHPALKAFVKSYAEQHKLSIVVQQGTCGVTAGKLRKKIIDVGAYCCPLAASDRLPSLQIHTIGVAAISLITHPDNPVTNLSADDAQKVFQGTYSRWSQLPNAMGKLKAHIIQPVVRLHCKKRPGHWRALLKNEDLFSPRIYEVGVIPDTIKQVALNPFAIGFETVYMLEVHKKNGLLKTLTIDNLNPNDLIIMAEGKYPIYRTYSLTSWKNSPKNSLTTALIKAIEKHIEKNSKLLGIVPSSILRKNGWTFKENELIAEPDGRLIHNSSHQH